MSEPNTSTGNGTENAKSHFTKAVEEAKAGAQALGKEAQVAAEGCLEKLNKAKSEWSSEAKVRSDEASAKASAFAGDAKIKAADLANQGKAKTSQAIVGLSRVIDDNAGLIDEKVGPKYGDYARTASKSMAEAAARLDEKSLDELGEEAKEFVRKSPGVAIGVAVAAGFLFGRLFKSGK
ncbi:hypothetical protein [Novosphingobium sp. ST904]|uniref:hypothetical protein n=1 Tax=Novosphingobium sp. ST904 TaxID=1684385 RepID=UPI0006C86C75|nr:hypothetical protein [Novosphingobium sp. ST904]KPH66552.1 hypothetical protein ADT71_05460 [Novosphingobium sp. ST904]TCM42333.1 hypothetical protein EDF59_102297 [Novosphingobium sp. ST904]